MRMLLPLLALAAVPICAQPEGRPEILVLGTYHMGNPGRDIHNIQADDVLAANRQQEIGQVIEVLKRFHPTKIAIESAGKARPTQYANYLTGNHMLSNSETEQIGFRLAKELGHGFIYPVDQEGEFPWARLVNYAKANGLAEKFNGLNASLGREAKELEEFLRSHTVLEMLERMNSDSMAAKGVAWYFAFVPFGEPSEYAGPDLLAAWYQRNIRIYSNIVRLIESPNEKILVIFGAGHLGWLRQNVSNDASVKLRTLSEFMGRQ